MNLSRRQKAAAGAGFVAIAATAVLGGLNAQFTDRDATDVQTLQAGTVQVDLTEGAGWDTSGLLLAIDDTVSRDVTVTNNGNLALGSVVLSADTTGALADAVTVSISQDGTPVATDVAIGALTDYTLDLTDLAPGADSVLTFEYDVVGDPAGTTSGDREDFVANPDNQFQDTAMDITYTVDAVQRAGISQ